MKLNSSAIAGISLVVAAILGGAAGGAMVLSDDGPEPPRVQDVRSTSTDGEVAPSAPPATAPDETPSPSAPQPVAPAQEATVTEPNQTPEPESTPKATAPKPTPAPEVEAPAATPVPTPRPECVEGEKQGLPYRGDSTWTGGQGGEQTCISGKWVVTKEPVDATPPPSGIPTGPGGGNQ